MATINTDLTLDAINEIFDNDKFYIKLFKNLLDAVIHDDFTGVSKTPTEIENLFKEIKFGSDTKVGVKTFIENEIYDKVYSNSTLYEGLIGALIDIYSVLYTIVRMRRDITELSIQPDEVVDAYLDSFGFKGKELFNYTQRREIAKVIYWYLRRKGTPAVLIKFLDMLGFSYFFISEYELCETSDPLVASSHKYTSRLIYEEKPENDAIGFFDVSDYSYEEVREADPLLIKTDAELSRDTSITYPAQSPYYQIGISVTYPDLEYRINAFSNAMMKKLKIDEANGEDIFKCQVNGYSGRVSYISLVLGYTYILGEYFGLVNEGNSFNSPIFGWNKDVLNSTPLEIMNDIERELKDLFILLSWQPDEEEKDTGRTVYIEGVEESLLRPKNTIKTRKEALLEKIKDTFYVDSPMYSSYDEMVEDFRNHDPQFKNYIDSILLTKEERIELYESGEDELKKNYDSVLDLINEILGSMEYYIFDTTSFIIPVKNLALSYANAMDILKKLDKYYTPYHAKLLFPQIVWLIRDLPGDIVAIEDNNLRHTSENYIHDVVWRASNYKVLDYECPEPYAPITDWNVNDDGMPHVPISLKYLNEPYYDRLTLQTENDLLYSVGYDWRNISNYPLIVRGEPYQLYTDWDPDDIKCHTTSIIEDVVHYYHPDLYWMNAINTIQQIRESKKVLVRVESFIITGDGRTKTFRVTHNYKSKDLFVTVYDIDTGLDVNVSIELKTKNYISISFNSNVDDQKQYKVLILSPILDNSDELVNQYLTGQVFKIIDVGYLKNYMFIHDLSSKDIFQEVHHKLDGQNLNIGFMRKTDDIVYLTLNNPSVNTRNLYTVSMLKSIENIDTDKLTPKEVMFDSFDFNNINTSEQSSYIIEHNFGTSNIITRVYDSLTNRQVNVLIEKLDVDRLSINFSNTVGSGSYRVLIIGLDNKFYKTSIPLNNITGYSTSFICDGVNSSYVINHNLNSLNTYEQVIDKTTGDIVRVSFDRIDANTLKVNLNEEYVSKNRHSEYIVYVIAPLDVSTVITPSTIYNTGFKSFTIKQDKSHQNAKSFNIVHNLNNEKVIVQIYDNYRRKVYGLVNIVDENTVKLTIGKPLSSNDYLKINILSLPNESISLSNFEKNKKAEHFINMFDYVISQKALTNKTLKFYEGGDATTESDLEFNSGVSNSEYSLMFNGGISSTAQIDDGPTTFEIKHNMGTESIIVNVFNERTKETIDAYVAINNRNTITIGIDEYNDLVDDIHVIIIGALRSNVKVDNKEIFDTDCVDLITPLQYTEFKIKEDEYYNHLSTEENLRFDMDDFYINEDSNETDRLVKSNINTFDVNYIVERVDIIHEIKDSNGNITTLTASGEDGFSKYNIRTNDPVWDQSVREDAPRPTLITYLDDEKEA